MCLAIPAKIVQLGDFNSAEVDILGVSRQIATDLTPQVSVGDYVLVHAGFSIEVIDETYAYETLELIRQLPQLAGENSSLLPEDFTSHGA